MEYELRGRSETRARLFIGGTYFRAKKTGGDGNNISIIMIEKDGAAQVIVVNHNPSEEMVTGQVIAKVLESQLEWHETVTITPTRAEYSISSQIAGAVPKLGGFSFSRVLYIPGKLTVQLTPTASEFNENDTILIKPLYRTYDLVQSTKVGGTIEEPTSESGWDIEALRSAMQDNPWIEMLPRGFDVQDTGVDDSFLSSFDETYLKSGDSLPTHPAGLDVGPGRYMVLVKETEAYNGALAAINKILNWNGTAWE